MTIRRRHLGSDDHRPFYKSQPLHLPDIVICQTLALPEELTNKSFARAQHLDKSLQGPYNQKRCTFRKLAPLLFPAWRACWLLTDAIAGRFQTLWPLWGGSAARGRGNRMVPASLAWSALSIAADRPDLVDVQRSRPWMSCLQASMDKKIAHTSAIIRSKLS